MFLMLVFVSVDSLVKPALSAVLLICSVNFAYVHVSAEYPKSPGRWQAILMIHVFSSSVISAFLPLPGAS